MALSSSKVWLITGCSSGLGQQLAIAARKRGDMVIATARKVETLEELKKLGCESLALDITASEDDVKQVVDKAHALYGRIDILVNNAGYTTFGCVEEASDKDVLDMFDTNVFGHLRVTRAVLPYMREKRSGVIANIGSGTGFIPFPINGVYGAAKFAIAGFTQSLAQEVAHLGIEVTVVELGAFLTSMQPGLRPFKHTIADYDQAKNAFQSEMGAMIAAGLNNPAKGAQALVEALTKTGRCAGRALPRRMPLGGGVLHLMEAELGLREKEKNEWVDFTEAATFALDP
ncbi:hypothetical protein Poli38472_007570 [Pythium oligandrum]|uniref:Uncharacterized protein n=1 Tax=Pythium oligandrum TaxID=41045 RepID=A0A8K1CTA7_PYTOL|nr:hypothetical protein Poli38472_007570 [Pythium oligandrum]|eukprot:TMW67898.1 hypothetical protein Poli38472_007570 [Pythium oligandrum]